MTHEEKSDLIRELRAEIEWDKALIERLKDKIRGLEKLNQMTDEEVVMELKAEISEHKALLAQAADALESYHPFSKECMRECNTCELTQELRKAAG